MLAAVLPLLAFSIGMALQNMHLERKAARGELRRLAVSAATVVDAHIARATLLLEALARSPDLQNGDMDQFEQHLRAVAAATGVVLLVANRAGEQVINSAAPHGKLDVPSRADVIERTLAEGKPDLSNVINGPLGTVRSRASWLPCRMEPLMPSLSRHELTRCSLRRSLAGPDIRDPSFVVVYDALESAEFSVTFWRLVTCAHSRRATVR